jgi:uncharacterized protein YlxW (UPF0749 family)
MDPMSIRSDRAGGPAEVDASMRLLREIMAQPVDPAYAAAAERRRHRAGVAARAGAGGGSSRTARSNRAAVALTLVLALVCGWVLTRGVAELRRPEPGQAAGRAALEQEITRRTRQADDRQRALDQLRAEIAAAQQAQLTSPEDADLARRVRELSLLTGEVSVSGPGMKITLTDARSSDPTAVVDPRAPAAAEDGRVLDRDLQIVVNGLWAAGAEAISINGRRLTALSAIRSAGQAILVDFRPLVPPYVVSAVGDPRGMQDRFTAGKAGGYVQIIRDNYGVGVEISAAGRLDLPGAGTLELRSALPVSSASPSGSPAASGSPATPAPSTQPAPSTEVSP